MTRTVYAGNRRGGHTGNDLREAFCEWAEAGRVPAGTVHQGRALEIRALTGLLWNCTDIVPSETCADLDLPAGSTYAQAARAVRKRLDRGEEPR